MIFRFKLLQFCIPNPGIAIEINPWADRKPSIDGVSGYEVERILDSQVFCGRLEYLVCWKGYCTADDQWVPARGVSGARRLVAEFHKQNPEAPQCSSAALYAPLPFQPLQNFTKPPTRGLFDWTKGRDLTCDPRLQNKGF